jgi:hypothetical protein
MSTEVNWYRFVYLVTAAGPPPDKVRHVFVYRKAISAADALVCEQINHGFSTPAAIIEVNYVANAPNPDNVRENEIVREWGMR